MDSIKYQIDEIDREQIKQSIQSSMEYTVKTQKLA